MWINSSKKLVNYYTSICIVLEIHTHHQEAKNLLIGLQKLATVTDNQLLITCKILMAHQILMKCQILMSHQLMIKETQTLGEH